MLTDYFAAGPLIVDRLTTAVNGVGEVVELANLVELAADEKALASRVRKDASVFVGWWGERPGDRSSNGALQKVWQQWIVLLAVRHAAQDDGRAKARKAGPLLVSIGQALQGWKPGADFGPLRRAQPPRPGFRPGLVIFPLVFETQISTLGTADTE